MQVDSPDHETGQIVSELQKGYMLKIDCLDLQSVAN